MRQAVIAYVLHKVYFGAETWWPGYSRPGPRTGSIPNQVQEHLDQIARVILTSIKTVLSIYHTTPTPVLYQESGLLPTKIKLDYTATIATAHLRRLDPYHPLRRRAERIVQDRHLTSHFARRVLALPESEQLNPLQHAPWLP
jgi:hypothetical protein